MEWQITEMGLSLPIVAVCYLVILVIAVISVKIK
jgi:hypothetical protein